MAGGNSVFVDWGNVLSAGRNDIVFEGRNISYGAYLIRQTYTRRVLISLLTTLVLVSAIIAIPYIMNMLSKDETKSGSKHVDTVTSLEAAPTFEKPPPPPKLSIPKQVEQVKFVPPKVVKKPDAEPELPKNNTPPKPPVPKAPPGKDSTVYVPPQPKFVPPPAPEQPYKFVEQMPTFPGGEDKLMEFLANNVKYPAAARENSIQGTVYVSFVVSSTGEISDAKIVRGVGGGLDQEAIRVVKLMPTWKPGKQNGRQVPVEFNLPIKFRLN